MVAPHCPALYLHRGKIHPGSQCCADSVDFLEPMPDLESLCSQNGKTLQPLRTDAIAQHFGAGGQMVDVAGEIEIRRDTGSVGASAGITSPPFCHTYSGANRQSFRAQPFPAQRSMFSHWRRRFAPDHLSAHSW